jgi:hypothetical protein
VRQFGGHGLVDICCGWKLLKKKRLAFQMGKSAAAERSNSFRLAQNFP